MTRRLILLGLTTAVCLIASTALAQAVVVYQPWAPVVAGAPAYAASYATYYSAPVVSSYYAPAVSYTAYSPVVAPYVSYYAPAPVPYVSYYAPVVRPYAAYAPVVRPYAAYAPVIRPYAAYSPVVTAYAAPVVVHPKVYVPGQPVRNFLRAVTP